MIGQGAPLPGVSGHDQALKLLNSLADPKGMKDRLDALGKATKAHHDAKAAAEKATSEAVKAAVALSKREADLAAREERLKEDKTVHNRNQGQAEALYQERAAALAERAAVFDKERKEHSEKVNDFARYREREVGAIAAKTANVAKLHDSVVEDRKAAAIGLGTLNERIAAFEKLIADVLAAIAVLKK